jgi:hypothetical protein
VADDSRADRLAATQPIVLVLRLVAEANGNVLYGEVMNAAGQAGDRGRRFVGLDGIAETVGKCVRDWVRDREIRVRGSETPFEPNGTQHGPVG